MLPLLSILTGIALVTTSNASDLGFSVGSSAASQLANHAVHSTLQQPRRVQLEVRNVHEPWFEPVAHLDTKAKVLLEQLKVNFHDGWIEVRAANLSLKSTTNIVVLPLPFFLGEDIAHVSAEVPEAEVRFKIQDMNIAVDSCHVEQTSLVMALDKGYFLNLLLKPLTGLLPSSLVHDYVCNTLSEHLGALRNRFALEIPLVSIVPAKFREYVHSANSTMRVQLHSIESDKEQLTLTAGVGWTETAVDDVRYDADSLNAFLGDLDEDHVAEQTLERLTVAEVPDESSTFDRSLQLWAEDRFFNEVMEKFDWDFEWMNEQIPVDSDRLPRSTREFLAVLCTSCYFELKVSANGPPHVESANHTLVAQKSDHIFMKVVNPTSNTASVFVSFYLTLTIQLIPEVEDGIFRTQVNLLSTEIRMEEGAFPSAWNEFVQDLVKGMIMDVIWPGLKKEIEALIYSDGLKIPSNCGLEPSSMKLHFDEGRFGVSSRLMLHSLSAKECLSQVKSKLPDPSKLLVIKDL